MPRTSTELQTLRDLKWTIGESQTLRAHSSRKPLLQTLFDDALADRTPNQDRIASMFSKCRNPKNAAQKAMTDLRRLLDEYFWTEGRGKPMRIEIEPSTWMLTLSPNRPPIKNMVDVFWEPYCEAMASNIIIFTEPLFYRRCDKLVYLRDVNCNDDNERQRLKMVVRDVKNWVPSYHYMSSGEVMAIFRLITVLSFRPVTVRDEWKSERTRVGSKSLSFRADIKTAKNMPDLNVLHGNNLIVIGSSRTNRFIGKLQDDHNCDIRLTAEGVQIRANRNNAEKPMYTDDIEATPMMSKYAILTRRYTPIGSYCATLIAANHGRAAEAVMNYVTDDRTLRGISGKVMANGQMRPFFQVLFRVQISREGGDVSIESIEPLAFR